MLCVVHTLSLPPSPCTHTPSLFNFPSSPPPPPKSMKSQSCFLFSGYDCAEPAEGTFKTTSLYNLCSGSLFLRLLIYILSLTLHVCVQLFYLCVSECFCIVPFFQFCLSLDKVSMQCCFFSFYFTFVSLSVLDFLSLRVFPSSSHFKIRLKITKP